MKLTCDLCGGELQMNDDGKGAVCSECGIAYDMERMQEKLVEAAKSSGSGKVSGQNGNGSDTKKPVTDTPVTDTPVIDTPVADEKVAPEKPAPAKQNMPVSTLLAAVCVVLCIVGGPAIAPFACIGAIVCAVISIRKSVKAIKESKKK